VEKSGRKKYITERNGEAPKNGKESSHSAHANGMNACVHEWKNTSKEGVGIGNTRFVAACGS
jgi:hypothetical protein